jgi:ribosomal protein S18 acetylase RimI-like enzyme
VAGVIIRTARKDELSAVLDLWREADATPSVTDSLDGLNALMGEPSATLLVAVADGRVVGSVIGGWDGWRGNIYRLAVAPAHRRKGIASNLVRAANLLLFDKGAQRISALVEHEHAWAVDFWDSIKRPRLRARSEIHPLPREPISQAELIKRRAEGACPSMVAPFPRRRPATAIRTRRSAFQRSEDRSAVLCRKIPPAA